MFKYVNVKRDNDKKITRNNTMITVGGMIGSGKTTVTNLIAEEMGFEAYYENVENNDILPLFYTASDEDKEKYRYPFLLQLEFLSSRFESIKKALTTNKNIVMDRSIYEDWYFARVNTDIGDISEQEFKIYEKLLNNMMQELEELPQKEPDLMVYLKISFEESLRRIGMRGRDFEQDEELYEYYLTLWSGYDNWVMNHYKNSDILIINMNEIDLELYPEQSELVLKEISKCINIELERPQFKSLVEMNNYIK